MTEPFFYANGQKAHDGKDLIELCQKFPDDSVHYLIGEDFEKWLSYIGAAKMAQYATEARQSNLPDRQKLDSFLSLVQPKPASEVKPEVKSEVKTPISATPSKSEAKTGFFEAIANFFKSTGNEPKNTNKPSKT